MSGAKEKTVYLSGEFLRKLRRSFAISDILENLEGIQWGQKDQGLGVRYIKLNQTFSTVFCFFVFLKSFSHQSKFELVHFECHSGYEHLLNN